MFGQGNVLYSMIQQIKKTNVVFSTVSVLSKVSAEKRVLNNFENPDEVIFFEYRSPYISNYEHTHGINLIIPVKDKNITLELMTVPDDFYNYEIITSAGEKKTANKNIKHYQGVVQGETNSLAAISFYEDGIMGLISLNDGNYNIVKDEQSGKHFIYNDKNLKERLQMVCGTTDEDSVSYKSYVLFQQRDQIIKSRTLSQQLQAAGRDKVVKFYFETEYDIYQTRGSVSSVEAFITGLYNQVAILYQNEDIPTQISSIYVWTSTDPYTGTTTATLLSQFQSTRTSFTGDLGMLLTFRSVGGGLAAGFNGLCNTSVSQRLAVAMLYNSYSNIPTYSWSVQVVTHEFGHLFGSRHTHACVWNGNNTAIDGCAGAVEGTCSLPGYPADGGTIMSYCHLSGRPGIHFSLGFGSQPGNVIRNSVSNASCLTPCDTPTNYTDHTVTSNTTVTGCVINVQNVTVENGAKLTLDAENRTVINGAFEVKLGSALEIK
jgi:hypothetical protein